MDPCRPPQEVNLHSCIFEGAGLEECCAGESASFRIQACDSQGYRLSAGHADFSLAVTAAGNETAGVPSPEPEILHLSPHWEKCVEHMML